MHTEIFNNIDLLIEMAGSTLNVQEIENDLIHINKEIQDKKQRVEDLKSMMNDTRYFNASSELVDRNIEVSLKSKITRLNQKIKDVRLKLERVQADEKKYQADIDSLKEKIEASKKYLSILHTKTDQNNNYQAVIDREENYVKKLEEELKDKDHKHEEILKEVELHEQALEELSMKKDSYDERLKDVLDNLNNPNAYIDEDLKKQDEEELKTLNDRLEELQKKKLEYLTDPNMIGADAKELISNNNYTEALNKIKELLTIVKEKPFMNVNNLGVLDEELEKLENERTELSNYIDRKNYAEVNSDILEKRTSYLNEELEKSKTEIRRYQTSIQEMDQNINEKLSLFIQNLEEEIAKISKEIEEYQNMLQDESKSRRTKMNLENAILKKEKDKEVMDRLLEQYKKDLLFHITMTNTLTKIIQKYEQYIDDTKSENEELQHITILEANSKDYIEEEKDKEKLKSINDEIKQIKNRKKFERTPDEIYDQIEMLLANVGVSKKEEKISEDNQEIDAEIDDLFKKKKEEPLIKVVEMIPAETIQSESSGGSSYGA